MTFDSIASQASELTDSQQASMFFYLLGKMDGFYRYDLEREKCLSKHQALQIVNDSLQAVK